MPKDALYFSHDFGARNDPKMINLQIKHGMAGIGCFWCIVEMLFEEGGSIPIEYDRLAFVLRMDPKIIESIINDFGLFVCRKNILSSNSVLKRMEIRNEKSKKAKESANNRWKNNEKNTNASISNAIASKNDAIKKERKERKERKEIKESKERKKVSSAKISENGNFSTEQISFPFEEDVSKNKKKEVVKIEFRAAAFRSEMDALLNSSLARYSVFEEEMETFYAYWTEANSSKTKMRFEMQKTFEIAKRIGYWIHRAKKSIIRNPEQEDKTTKTLRILHEQRDLAIQRIESEEAEGINYKPY